jgi:phenylacetate-CoA ligase
MTSLEKLYQHLPAWAQTLMLNAYGVRLRHYRQDATYRAAVSQLLKSQSCAAERLQTYRDECIHAVVSVAYEKTAFYRRVMDSRGLKPGDIRGALDLQKLPVISREIVREHGAEFLTASRPPRSWHHGHTSGTTGSPLSLWYDRHTCIMNDAVDRRQKIWGGMAESDWIGVLLGRVIVPPDQRNPPFWRTNHVQRQVWFSSFHLSEENLAHYVREIRQRRLQFLEGYPSTLFILAQYVAKRRETLPLQAVFTSSETLHRVQRDAIEGAFGCRPFDFYGHAERTIFATECEQHDGKHLAEEYGYTEVVDDEGRPLPDGETGYLVGTTLHNTAMPLIRYRTGDISAIRREPCACGRTLSRIESVTTKAEDIVITPDGRMVSPSILTHPFKPFPQIVESQLIQDRADHLLVKIVPSAEFDPMHQAILLGELERRLGSSMKIEIQLVDAIARETSGKFRWIISLVDHPTHFRWGLGDS